MPDSKLTPPLWTVGTLAKKLNAPVAQIEYAIKANFIPHICMIGHSRAFDQIGFDRVKTAIESIRQKKEFFQLTALTQPAPSVQEEEQGGAK